MNMGNFGTSYEQSPKGYPEVEALIGSRVYETRGTQDDGAGGGLGQEAVAVMSGPLAGRLPSVEDMMQTTEGLDRRALCQMMLDQQLVIRQREAELAGLKQHEGDPKPRIETTPDSKVKADPISPLPHAVPGRRPIARPKSLKPEDVHGDTMAVTRPPSSFLRDDVESVVAELLVDWLLLRARRDLHAAARRHVSERGYGGPDTAASAANSYSAAAAASASASASAALDVARLYFANYEPVRARCLVYVGIAHFLAGRLDAALRALGPARACIGAYAEGEWVAGYAEACERRLGRLGRLSQPEDWDRDDGGLAPLAEDKAM